MQPQQMATCPVCASAHKKNTRFDSSKLAQHHKLPDHKNAVRWLAENGRSARQPIRPSAQSNSMPSAPGPPAEHDFGFDAMDDGDIDIGQEERKVDAVDQKGDSDASDADPDGESVDARRAQTSYEHCAHRRCSLCLLLR